MRTCRDVVVFLGQHASDFVCLPSLIRRLAVGSRGPRPSAVLTVADIFRLFDVITNARDALLVRLLYAAGLRAKEIVSLRIGGLDLDCHRVFLGSGRRGDERYVVVDAKTRELLRAWVWDQPLERVLFPLNSQYIWTLVRQWTDACGLTQHYAAQGLRVSATSILHSFATHCYMRGMSIAVLQPMLGVPRVKLFKYLHVDDKPKLYASRYQAAWRQSGAACPSAGGRLPGTRVPRKQVVEHLVALPPTASLSEVVDALRALHRLTRQDLVHEWQAEMGTEVPPLEVTRGSALPFVPTVASTLALCDRSALARFLYRSGVRWDELPGVQLDQLDRETGLVPVEVPGRKPRMVAIDPETAKLVTPEVLGLPWESVEERARQTGLLARSAALDRKFTASTLRHAYAVHLYEAGLDLETLHELLGNEYKETTNRYTRVAVARWLPEYLRCHPLASE